MTDLVVDPNALDLYVSSQVVDEDYPIFNGSYAEVYESMGLTPVWFESSGGWSGDLLFLLRDVAGNYALVVTAYGSCSSCDAMQATSDPEAAFKLASSRIDKSLCGTPAEIVGQLESERPENRWWNYDDEVPSLMSNIVEVLRHGAQVVELYSQFRVNKLRHEEALAASLDSLHKAVKVKAPKPPESSSLTR